MKVEIELPEIEGYEYTGEYRAPEAGETVLVKVKGTWIPLELDHSDLKREYPILRKKRWRAEYRGTYYTVNMNSGTSCAIRDSEYFGTTDNNRYMSGNYYQTAEEAEAAAEKIRLLFEYSKRS